MLELNSKSPKWCNMYERLSPACVLPPRRLAVTMLKCLRLLKQLKNFVLFINVFQYWHCKLSELLTRTRLHCCCGEGCQCFPFHSVSFQEIGCRLLVIQFIKDMCYPYREQKQIEKINEDFVKLKFSKIMYLTLRI